MPEFGIYLAVDSVLGECKSFNFSLFEKCINKVNCSGYEFTMSKNYESNIDEILSFFNSFQVKIPVFHFDRRISDCLGSPRSGDFEKGRYLFQKNIEYGKNIDSDFFVLSSSGMPFGDSNFDLLVNDCQKLFDIAKSESVRIVIEPVFAKRTASEYMKSVFGKIENVSFALNSAFVQLNREFSGLFADKSIWPERISHIYLNDFSGSKGLTGGYAPLLIPGRGNINWHMYFSELNKNADNKTFTLNPYVPCSGKFDFFALNEVLQFVSEGIDGNFTPKSDRFKELNFVGTEEIYTQDLILDRFVPGDADRINEIFKSCVICGDFSGFLLSKKQLKPNIVLRRWNKEYENKSSFNWAVRSKSENRLLGRILCTNIKRNYKSADLLLLFEKGSFNERIFSESLNAVTEFLFSEANFRKLSIPINKDDSDIIDYLRKCGYEYEGESSELVFTADNVSYRPLIFSILKDYKTHERN